MRPSKTIVLCFGTFDGLHDGHRFFLREAGKLGDSLIVIVARDETVTELKHRTVRLTLAERMAAIVEEFPKASVVAGDRVQGSWKVLQTYTPQIIALGHDQDALGSALNSVVTTAQNSFLVYRVPLRVEHSDAFRE